MPFTNVVTTILITGIKTAIAPVIMIDEATTSFAAFEPYL